MNYVHAMEEGIRIIDTIPLSLRLVRELHRVLMRDVRDENATPGDFRVRQNWIGRDGVAPADARFVPPPPETLIGHLTAWEAYMNTAGELPDLVQCALLHQQFESIHPFLEGNGRVGRLMITLFLMARGRLHKPLLYLSAFIERNRLEYYDLLLRVSTHGDWAAWLRFFLAGVAETARDASVRTRRLVDLRESYRARVRAISPAAQALVDQLFISPYVSARVAKTATDVSDPTARKIIDQFVTLGLLREVTGQSWGRIWRSDEVFATLHDPLPPATTAH
jgi:Fic family protein